MAEQNLDPLGGSDDVADADFIVKPAPSGVFVNEALGKPPIATATVSSTNEPVTPANEPTRPAPGVAAPAASRGKNSPTVLRQEHEAVVGALHADIQNLRADLEQERQEHGVTKQMLAEKYDETTNVYDVDDGAPFDSNIPRIMRETKAVNTHGGIVAVEAGQHIDDPFVLRVLHAAGVKMSKS